MTEKEEDLPPVPPPDDAPPPEGEKKKKKKKKHRADDENEPELPPTPSANSSTELLPPPAVSNDSDIPPPLPVEDDRPPALPPDDDDDEGSAQVKKKKKKRHSKAVLEGCIDGSNSETSDDQSPLPPDALVAKHHHRKSSKSLIAKSGRRSLDGAVPSIPIPDGSNSSGLTSPTMVGLSPLKESMILSPRGKGGKKLASADGDSSSSDDDSDSDVPPPPPPADWDEYSNDDDLKGASDEELPPIPEIVELKEELKKKKKHKKHKKKKHAKKGAEDEDPDLPPLPPAVGDVLPPIEPPPPIVDIPPPAPSSGDIPPPAASSSDIPPPPPPVGDIPPPAFDIAPPPIDIPPPPCSIYPADMMKKRFHVVHEILSTEKTYVSQLQLMVTMFVDKPECGLTADQILRIFANVKVIATCHKMFVEPLEQRVKTWTESSIISDLFLEARWIKLYKHYINQYDSAAKLVKEWRETVKPFKKYLKETEWTPSLQCTNLESLLVTPIQRLPRYVLLLEEMAKCTPENHPDQGKIGEAIALIRELTDYVNKCKKESNSTDELRAIEQKVVGLPFELVQSHRALVKEGPMKVDKEANYMWLFSDIAFITKTPSRGKYKFKESVNLNTAKLQQMEGTSFKIFSTDGLVNVNCGSVEEKMMWFQTFTDTINAVQKKMLTDAFTNNSCEAEGSQQFNESRLEKMAESREKQFKALFHSEKEYLHALELTRSTFLTPIKKAAMDKTNPMMSVQAAKDIIFNFTELRNEHKAIVRALKGKEPWTADSVISDIFGEHLERMLYLYREYIEHNAVQMATISACTQQKDFNFWLSKLEAESKLSLVQHLGDPLRRISEYYIALANLLQNTNPKSDDYAKLSPIVSKLSEFNEEFTLKNQPKLLESSLRRSTPRPQTKKQ